MQDWVFVDTCIWASFFTKPHSTEKLAVDSLIDAGHVALLGPLVAEVLLGCRRKNEADWVASRLRAAHYVEIDWNDWRSAADLGRELASLGHRLPLTDLVVAGVAKRLNAHVYSVDPHFDHVPDLKRYWP
ncbi:MAG: PIN domain-containing protein [Rhodopirellula sp.]|nr:PIN domain-containing protein [Rhodopirellula sp.]